MGEIMRKCDLMVDVNRRRFLSRGGAAIAAGAAVAVTGVPQEAKAKTSSAPGRLSEQQAS